jgi:hypothetical protein
MDWVEETYSWRDDVMEITRRIIHETEKARLSKYCSIIAHSPTKSALIMSLII